MERLRPPAAWARRNRILDDWCARVGRDPRAIERTAYVGFHDLPRLGAYLEAGATHLICPLEPPFNTTPIERLLAWRGRARSLRPLRG